MSAPGPQIVSRDDKGRITASALSPEDARVMSAIGRQKQAEREILPVLESADYKGLIAGKGYTEEEAPQGLQIICRAIASPGLSALNLSRLMPLYERHPAKDEGTAEDALISGLAQVIKAGHYKKITEQAAEAAGLDARWLVMRSFGLSDEFITSVLQSVITEPRGNERSAPPEHLYPR